MQSQDNSQSSVSPVECQESPKKPYESPTLLVHGTVAQITQFVGPASGDGIIGSQIVISDRNAKQDFAPVDPQAVLARLVVLPLETWSYKSEDASVRHIGPMAQDFAAAFGVGDNDKHIHMVDANGVTIASIQALYGMIQQRDEQIDGLRRELEQIKQRLAN